MINARSLAPKLDELEILLHESSADVAAVSETCLHKDIDSKYLEIQGFNLFRRDRLNGRGGGVCTYVSNAIPSKRCNNLASEAFECLWLLLRTYRLPRNITGIILGILYNPPDKSSEEQHNITDYLLENLDNVCSTNPDCGIALMAISITWTSGTSFVITPLFRLFLFLRESQQFWT